MVGAAAGREGPLMGMPRYVRIRCVQCRRNTRRLWAGLGPMPQKCERCLRANARRRNAASLKHRRYLDNLRSWQPAARADRSDQAAGMSAAVETANARARRMAGVAPNPHRSWQTQEFVGCERGRYYRGTIPESRSCAVCRRPVATMRTRPVCLDCLGKGER